MLPPPPPATPFFGREHELARLKELANKKTASLVVIKGRRRIGKSRLTDEFARQMPRYTAVHLQGLPPSKKLTAEQEREDFAQQLAGQLQVPPPRADDWNTLLRCSCRHITRSPSVSCEDGSVLLDGDHVI